MSFQKLGIGTRNPYKSLDVSGSVMISNSLDVSGDVTVSGKLSASRDVSLNADVDISGDVTVNGRVDINGDSTFSSDINVNSLTVGRGSGNIIDNTAYGYQTLYNNTTGTNNTAYGYETLYNNTAGTLNTAFGIHVNRYGSMQGSVGIGRRAMFKGSSTNSVAIGNSASYSGGNNTVAIGHSALRFNTTGGENVAVGGQSLNNQTSTSNNTAIGYKAGWDVSNNAASQNTFIGAETGFDVSINDYTYSTALGYGALIDSSNQIMLGRNTETVVVPGELNVYKAATLKSTLYVSKAVTVASTLAVTGKTTLHNDVSMNSNVDISGDLVINGIVSTTNKFGIGTTNPTTLLYVNGYVNIGNYSKYVSENNSYGSWTGPDETSIYASNGIGCDFISFHSDKRIKKNIVDVPDNLALQQVRDIPCRYYEYIDFRTKGTDKTIGFIAQEVNEVLPMAITKRSQIIPDEYRMLENISWEEIVSDISGNNAYKMSSDLSGVIGINYKFIVANDISDNPIEKEIIGNSDDTFTFDASYRYVFCYGKEVNDFHTIDKNKIFALHHSAIQEIDKLQLEEKDKVTALETKVTALEINVTALETKNTELETKNAELQSQIDNIMTILNNNNLS